MKKVVFWMSIVVLAVLVAVAPRRSDAIGGESLGCFVNVGDPGVYTSPECFPTIPRTSYTIHFRVFGGSGTYTYSWATNGATVSSGCTSTSDFCLLSVRANSGGDRTFPVSVTLTQAGQQTTVSAFATIQGTCFLAGQPVFC